MIPVNLKNNLIDIVAAYPDVKRLLLFGSRAHGDYQERSDVDLALEAPGLSNDSWLLLCQEIEELETLLKIDLLRLDAAPEKLLHDVQRCHKVLFERTGEETNLTF
ncbi:nucleotidyltransferase domain-containing protein [Jeotgalibacillus aurantiacus]|uniref:nucleotidyltransferase domain-containing protein n=1 Tax=Jeotgalibacillus aurantiacus TaxID=2763266 RepID=UPI001D0AE552|nr:nucleotidyltransferase domain-containing protein [Jeotgalibacillus aurantiacus]